MEIDDKRCFVIEFDFSNGEPMNAFEDKDFKYKGRDWWNVELHKRDGEVVESECDLECDIKDDDGIPVTMSCLYISVPKKK